MKRDKTRRGGVKAAIVVVAALPSACFLGKAARAVTRLRPMLMPMQVLSSL